tara:strand:+ start:21 stop:197 length:177 start_codon:yes stop_codon:yes gene_type:complete
MNQLIAERDILKSVLSFMNKGQHNLAICLIRARIEMIDDIIANFEESEAPSDNEKENA